MCDAGALRGCPASTTTTRRRARVRTSAADRPAAPPPMTATSYVLMPTRLRPSGGGDNGRCRFREAPGLPACSGPITARPRRGAGAPRPELRVETERGRAGEAAGSDRRAPPEWAGQPRPGPVCAVVLTRWLECGSGQLERREFRARGDCELGEHVAQVEVDRPGGQEQLGGCVAVAQALPHQFGDVSFLRGEVDGGAGVPPAGGLARRPELVACPCRPAFGADVLEGVQCGAEVLARVDPATRAPEELAERQLCPGLVDLTG